MPYWRLFYHLVWATHEREPLLVSPVEEAVRRVICHQCEKQGGQAFAVNGMPDHVHVISTIPPSIPVAAFVKNLKGTTSRFASQEFDLPFQWQAGYGAFSVSERNLEQAVDYIRRQKEHHATGQIIARYERFAAPDDRPA